MTRTRLSGWVIAAVLAVAGCGGGPAGSPSTASLDGYWQVVESTDSRGTRHTYENAVIELRDGRYRSNVDTSTSSYVVYNGREVRIAPDVAGPSVTFSFARDGGTLTFTQPGKPTRFVFTALTDEAGAAAIARPGRMDP